MPTEAEWEYAARAGTDTPYWWGGEVGQGNANCANCGNPQWDNERVAPVGSFKPNAFGLYDTAGNVWEWICTEWKTELDRSANECAGSEAQTNQRVLRGGSWNVTTVWLRSSARHWYIADFRVYNVGFRVFRAARTN